MFDISNHPVVLCAGTAAAVLAICSGITFTWIVPTMVTSVNNKLELQTQELKKVLIEREKADAKILELGAELVDNGSRLAEMKKEHSNTVEEKDKHIAELRIQLFESQKTNLFVLGSPYPIGFDKVKVGDPVTKIFKEYRSPNKSDSSASAVFDVPSDVFDWIGFQYDNPQKGVVESIVLSVGVLRDFGENPKPDLPENWIETTLKRTLGDSFIEIGPDKRCLVWVMNDANKSLVYYRKRDTDYMISNTMYPAGCYITKDQQKEIGAKNRHH